jgi:hypothetical protein
MDATRSAVTLLGAALVVGVNLYFFGQRRKMVTQKTPPTADNPASAPGGRDQPVGRGG